MKERNRKDNLVVNLGLFTNIILSGIKILVGIVGKSQGLLADGINSTSDVTYYLVVKVLMKFSKKPPDDRHPYGHRQLESISAVIIGAFIVTTALALFWYSINSIYKVVNNQTEILISSNWPIVIAVFTVILKIFLFIQAKNVYKKTENPTIKALATDHINDMLASTAVTIGIIMAKMGYHWVDPLAGAIVAIFIFKTGIEIVSEASWQLMDTIPNKDFSKSIKKIANSIDKIENVEEIGIHRFGPDFIINMTIQIDGNLRIYEGDQIADKLEKKLKDQYGSSLFKVNIHYHP